MNIISWILLCISWAIVYLLQFKDLFENKNFGAIELIALGELVVIFWMIKRFDSIITRILNKKGKKDE